MAAQRTLGINGIGRIGKLTLWHHLGLSLIHISEPTRLLSKSYAVFCLKKKKKNIIIK